MLGAAAPLPTIHTPFFPPCPCHYQDGQTTKSNVAHVVGTSVLIKILLCPFDPWIVCIQIVYFNTPFILKYKSTFS
jgi:hypothetical protein